MPALTKRFAVVPVAQRDDGWNGPARVAFFIAGGLAGEIMALTKKQKARRAAIIKILTELSCRGTDGRSVDRGRSELAYPPVNVP
jgi:hypothetical protein